MGLSNPPPAGQAWGPPRATPGRIVAIAWSAAAVAAVVLPILAPPPPHPGPLSATVRTALVVALATAMLFGPGLAVRFYRRGPTSLSLGWAILPGGALLAATGLLAWGMARAVPPATTCRVILGLGALVLFALAIGSLWRRGRLAAGEGMAVTVVLLLLLVGVGRDLYSLGPPGELYGTMISRTYEATIVPDSRIPFEVVQLVAHGASPYGALGTMYFFPYNFSARGPLAGLAAVPLVLTAGARVPTSLPDQPWQPFDPQGFAAYRLTLEAFGAFALLSLFGLVRRFASVRTALFATLLAATTPFVVHEVYFTWPKLISAGTVLLAAEQLLRRRPLRSGLLVGLSYLLHPVGLVAYPGLLMLSAILLWRREPSRRVGAILWDWARMLAGTLVVVVTWQALNLGHLQQSGFLQYPFEAGTELGQGMRAWVDWRLLTLADTLIPFHQLLTNSTQPYTFPPGQHARAAVRLGIGYWGTLTLGAGVLCYPLLLFGIGKSLLRHPFVTAGCVLMPFVAFAVYWGSIDLGLMLAGLQAWLLGTLVVYAWTRSAPGWWPVRLERWILMLRVPEIGFMILFPAVWTQRRLVSTATPVTDLVGLGAIVVGLGGLLWFVWRVADPATRVQESLGDASMPAEGLEARAIS